MFSTASATVTPSLEMVLTNGYRLQTTILKRGQYTKFHKENLLILCIVELRKKLMIRIMMMIMMIMVMKMMIIIVIMI